MDNKKEITLNKSIRILKNNIWRLPPKMKEKVDANEDLSFLKYHIFNGNLWFLFEDIDDPGKVLHINGYYIQQQNFDGTKFESLPKPDETGYYHISSGLLTKACKN